jgi:hypothetical protein
MYDDIVASTHPLNYNPALFNRKFDYDSHFFGIQRGPQIPNFSDDTSIIEDFDE